MKAHIALESASPFTPGLGPKPQAQRRPASLRHQSFTALTQHRRQKSHSLCRSVDNGSSPPSNGSAPSDVSTTADSSGPPELDAAALPQGIRLVGTFDGGDGDDEMSALDARIMRGEYSTEGSTLDRLTRPIRRALIKNPLGPGTTHRTHVLCCVL